MRDEIERFGTKINLNNHIYQHHKMEKDIEKHSFSKSITLHLFPGLLIGGFYFLLAPFVKEQGFPTIMALTLAGVLVLVPFELGYLLHQRRKTGEPLFGGIIKYCNRIPFWQYLIWIPLIFVLSGFIFKGLSFTSDFFKSLFNWIPENMMLDMGLSEQFSRKNLIITYTSSFLFFAVIFPTVEELYFRGYLMPRMPSKLKGWTPLTHSLLFALYHTWTPWMFFVRTVGLLPLIYIMKRKENILLAIISHCLLNSLDFIIGFVFIFNIS